jgi:hypothetical protein
MNRKKTIFFLLLNIMISVAIYCQHKANNVDFYSYWKLQNNEKKITENSYKSQFSKQVVNHIDSLISIGIDTIGVYHEAFPGYKTSGECDAGSDPWTTYVQWEKNGKAYQKEFTQRCKFKEQEIGIAMIIRYYINASSKIKNEIIYPVITKINRYKNGKIKSSVSSYIDHCACYKIFCLIKRDATLKRFDEYQINENTNLFYQQNMESATNSWRKMIENQINNVN